MMIARKPIGRRTLLRGLGACLALPLMEGMSSSAKAAEAAAAACKRFQVIYLPNGMVMQNWTPAELGENYTLSPILKPMAPFRDKFAVIKNLDHVMAEAMGDGGQCLTEFQEFRYAHVVRKVNQDTLPDVVEVPVPLEGLP